MSRATDRLGSDRRAWFGVVRDRAARAAWRSPRRSLARHDPFGVDLDQLAPAAVARSTGSARTISGSRRVGAPRLRRARLAVGRHRLAGHRALARRAARTHRRLLRPVGRRARDAPRRRDAGVSDAAAAHRARRRAPAVADRRVRRRSASSAGQEWRGSFADRCSSFASWSSCRRSARSARAIRESSCSTSCRASSRPSSSRRRSASPGRSWPSRRCRFSVSACSRRRRVGASMIADGRDLYQLRHAPWTSVFPGLAIGSAVLGFNLLGDALRDALDPRASTCDPPPMPTPHERYDVEALRAREFPWAVDGETNFLNHASTGPLPATNACVRSPSGVGCARNPHRIAHELQFGTLDRSPRADRAADRRDAVRDRAGDEHELRHQPRRVLAAARRPATSCCRPTSSFRRTSIRGWRSPNDAASSTGV